LRKEILQEKPYLETNQMPTTLD